MDAIDISTTTATIVELRYADTVIFKSTLHPIDGTIALRDIASLLYSYLGAKKQTFSVWLDGSKKAETDIIPCTLHLDCTAEEWNGESLLTRATNKYTHATAKELIHFTATGASSAKVTIVMQKGGAVSIGEATMECASDGDIVALDVSPSVLPVPEGYELVTYTVEVGKAKMTYRMIPDGMADNVHEFGFINSFLQEEYITLMGAAERELKVERLHAMVGGQYRNYQVEAVPHWTIESGMMLEGMEGLFDDFISSKKVWRKSDGVMMAVTDSDFKVSDANDATCEGSVTLREAGRTYRHRPVRPVKTFDETFDDTFQ